MGLLIPAWHRSGLALCPSMHTGYMWFLRFLPLAPMHRARPHYASLQAYTPYPTPHWAEKADRLLTEQLQYRGQQAL